MYFNTKPDSGLLKPLKECRIVLISTGTISG